MRSPSVGMIEKRLNITLNRAKLLKKWMTSAKSLADVREVMKKSSILLGGYGAEYELPGYVWVNMGETYTGTLMYNEKKKLFFISSMGDVAEKIYLR